MVVATAAMESDYVKLTPADVHQFINAGSLDLLTHKEARDIGFAAPEESWPRTYAGRMRSLGSTQRI
jgi:hypothetical protein